MRKILCNWNPSHVLSGNYDFNPVVVTFKDTSSIKPQTS